LSIFLLVDDKGQTFLSLFGLPPSSHENNAIYAVKAAVHATDALNALGLSQFTIGMSTGDLLFSNIGSIKRCESGNIGNLAYKFVLQNLNV
jgi:class 3 adenylate cyclase